MSLTHAIAAVGSMGCVGIVWMICACCSRQKGGKRMEGTVATSSDQDGLKQENAANQNASGELETVSENSTPTRSDSSFKTMFTFGVPRRQPKRQDQSSQRTSSIEVKTAQAASLSLPASQANRIGPNSMQTAVEAENEGATASNAKKTYVKKMSRQSMNAGTMLLSKSVGQIEWDAKSADRKRPKKMGAPASSKRKRGKKTGSSVLVQEKHSLIDSPGSFTAPSVSAVGSISMLDEKTPAVTGRTHSTTVQPNQMP